MKLSIVSVTRRWGALDVYQDNFSRQTILPDLIAHEDVEWMCCDEHALDSGRQAAFERAWKEVGFKENQCHLIYPPDYRAPRYCKLARANNTALDHADGELIWFLNDFISTPDDCLEGLLVTNTKHPHALLTSICHWLDPTGLTVVDRTHPYSIFDQPFKAQEKVYSHSPIPVIWEDPRAHQAQGAPPWVSWEANCALAPTSSLRQAGGWHEEFDYAIGNDNVCMAFDVMRTDPLADVIVLLDSVCFQFDKLTHDATPSHPSELEARNMEWMVDYMIIRQPGKWLKRMPGQ